MASIARTPNWPSNAQAAICLTFDNMGEAADINRGLWPSDTPIGSHYSVTRVLPKFLALVRKYNLPITYFAESWNLGVYPNALKSIAADGHEVAFHAWQHEAWAKECKDEKDERANFERSFRSDEGMRGFLEKGNSGNVTMYRGFRPPGGTINGERTLKLCREYGLGYISPAAHEGAVVTLDNGSDSIVVLPFRWSTVDAYYYMESFSGLRRMKGVLPEKAQGPDVLVKAYIRQIDETIEGGGFLSLLFHPFLTDDQERMDAMEMVIKHLATRREEGKIWLAKCRDVEEWARSHQGALGEDPRWDNSSWR